MIFCVLFLPIFASVCDEEQCSKLITHPENPDEFGTEFPIPTISKKDKTFGTDLWRGPVWINYNYMISKSLANYGYEVYPEKSKTKPLKL